MGVSMMETQAGPVRRSLAQWQELIARGERSGLPVAAFCRREGISTASFYTWRKRLGGAAAPQAAAPAFVELGTLPGGAGARGGGWDIELELEAGVVLRLRRR